MASRPTQPEDTSEYIAWARNQELQKDCYSVSYSNESIEHNVAEILSLLRNYSAILGMIHVKLVGFPCQLIHDRRNRGRKHFPDVLYLSNDLTVCENVDDFADSNYDSDESRLVWHTLDTATLFDVSDELRMFPIFKENGFYPVPRNWDQTIDFETLMGEAFTLIDEALLPLLIAVKNQLASIPQCFVMSPNPTTQGDPSEYLARARNQELQKDFYSIPPSSNENVVLNVAEIRALLSINSEILGRIRHMMVGSLGQRNYPFYGNHRGTKFRRLEFSDLVYVKDVYITDDLTDPDNVDDDILENEATGHTPNMHVCRTYPTQLVWHTFDTDILFVLSDELEMFPICRGMSRNEDGTIDFESLMRQAFTLIDEASLPLLLAVKNQLVSIQHCLGEIEEWIIEPSKYIRRIFGDDLHCLQLSYMANHCDQEVPFVLGKKAFKLKVKGQWNHQFDISSDDDVEVFQKFWNFL